MDCLKFSVYLFSISKDLSIVHVHVFTAQASQQLFEKSDRKNRLFKFKIIGKYRNFLPKYRLFTGKISKKSKKF